MPETNIRTGKRTPIAEGGIARVHRSEVSLERGDKIRFVKNTFTIREFKLPEVAKHKIDETILKHSQLKKLGIPVIPTYRKISDTEILMTDLTDGGEYSVFSPNNIDPTTNKPLELLNNFEEIFNECDKIFQICLENSIYLHPDSMFIVMDENGSGKVYIADYDEVKFDSNTMPMSNPLYKSYSHIVGRYTDQQSEKRFAFKEEFMKRTSVI
jgi:hypothetical protein